MIKFHVVRVTTRRPQRWAILRERDNYGDGCKILEPVEGEDRHYGPSIAHERARQLEKARAAEEAAGA